MRWQETQANKCRYGEIAERIFGEADIIWEHSEVDYQGYATVLAAFPDGTFAHYFWSYGSCSGCDDWENRHLSDDQVEAEMRQGMAVIKDVPTLRRYLHLEGVPIDAEDFCRMAYAAQRWLEACKGEGDGNGRTDGS